MLLESCGDELPGLRDRALLSAAYDTGLCASELVAVALEHIEEATIPRRGCCRFCATRAIRTGRGGRLSQLAHIGGDRYLERSGRDHSGAAVSAGAGAALQGARRLARPADRQHLRSGEDLAGIIDAVQWKSPPMPLVYNRNLAAEEGAFGRLAQKLE